MTPISVYARRMRAAFALLVQDLMAFSPLLASACVQALLTSGRRVTGTVPRYTRACGRSTNQAR